MGVNDKMTAIADSIRAKSGITGALGLDAMKTAIDGIQASGASNIATGTKTINSSSGTVVIATADEIGFKPDVFALVLDCSSGDSTTASPRMVCLSYIDKNMFGNISITRNLSTYVYQTGNGFLNTTYYESGTSHYGLSLRESNGVFSNISCVVGSSYNQLNGTYKWIATKLPE